MASSMQEYLKRYASESEKKKTKKKRKPKASNGGALTIVDADPVWQKDVKEASSESEADQEDAPLVIKDVEFKRMQRLEALRMRPYIAIAEDGSGWISVNEDRNQGSLEMSFGVMESPTKSKHQSSNLSIGMDVESPQERDVKGHSCESPDLSPPRKKHAQSLSPPRCDTEHHDLDLSPERRGKEIRNSRHDTPDRDLSPPRRNAQPDDGDLSPKRRERTLKKRRYDTPDRDLSPPRRDAQFDDVDLSPQRRKRDSRKSRHDTPDRDLSPPRRHTQHVTVDLSPPRREKDSKKSRHDTPDRDLSPPRCHAQHVNMDLSPPRREKDPKKIRHDTPDRDLSPPRRHTQHVTADLSPPRSEKDLKKSRHDTPDRDLSPPRRHTQHVNADLSPPRREKDSKRGRHDTPDREDDSVSLGRRRFPTSKRGGHNSPTLSPPKTGSNQDLSPPRRRQRMDEHDKDDTDLSLTRRSNRDVLDSRDLQKYKKSEAMADGTAAGLVSGGQLAKEMVKKKQNDSRRLKELKLSVSGHHANTVYRDKHGKRLEGVDEILKLQQAEETKKEEKPLEWGKGLVQKREAEAKYAELEAEKMKPFARTRDDPDLDKSLKEQIRWGDPMAHLVKKKVGEPLLMDLGASEQMKDSGFIVPQAIPNHSWLKRGITPPANRYGIKPGRHWDGVDRSTGYERDMYKKQNEKKAQQEEAYLWSVADM